MKKKALFTPVEKKNIYVLSLVLFFRMFSVFLVLPVFTYLANDLSGATPFIVGLAFGAYGLTQGLFQIPFGLFSDIFGRKIILLIGLIVFSIGSLMVAVSEDIYFVTAGRFIQGVGAVSSVIFAYIADITRPEIRSAANAFLGMSIGVSFMLAFVAAPTLSVFIGLNGLFYVIFGLGVCAVMITWLAIPRDSPQTPSGNALHYIMTALKQKSVYEIYFGAFLVGTCLTFFLFNVQMDFKVLGFPKEKLWMVYVPILFVSAPAMFVAALTAQKHYRFKEVMAVATLVLIAALGAYYVAIDGGGGLYLLVAALFLFFIAFNMFEPIFPSLLTIKCDSHIKGTASGFYNFFMFMGNFCGSLTAGYFYALDRKLPVYIIIALLILFLFVSLSTKNPVKRPPVNART